MERQKRVQFVLEKWEKENKRCTRLKKKAPQKPKVRKDFPHASTSEHLKDPEESLLDAEKDEGELVIDRDINSKAENCILIAKLASDSCLSQVLQGAK